MDNKTRNVLKMVAVIIVLLMVLMDLNFVVIPMLVAYKFWLVVIAFAMMLIAGK
ncbi:MAG: hypothetical protein RJQ09_16250 [Cyclobacteriaceae bacterium]